MLLARQRFRYTPKTCFVHGKSFDRRRRVVETRDTYNIWHCSRCTACNAHCNFKAPERFKAFCAVCILRVFCLPTPHVCVSTYVVHCNIILQYISMYNMMCVITYNQEDVPPVFVLSPSRRRTTHIILHVLNSYVQHCSLPYTGTHNPQKG